MQHLLAIAVLAVCGTTAGLEGQAAIASNQRAATRSGSRGAPAPSWGLEPGAWSPEPQVQAKLWRYAGSVQIYDAARNLVAVLDTLSTLREASLHEGYRITSSGGYEIELAGFGSLDVRAREELTIVSLSARRVHVRLGNAGGITIKLRGLAGWFDLPGGYRIDVESRVTRNTVVHVARAGGNLLVKSIAGEDVEVLREDRPFNTVASGREFLMPLWTKQEIAAAPAEEAPSQGPSEAPEGRIEGPATISWGKAAIHVPEPLIGAVKDARGGDRVLIVSAPSGMEGTRRLRAGGVWYVLGASASVTFDERGRLQASSGDVRTFPGAAGVRAGGQEVGDR